MSIIQLIPTCPPAKRSAFTITMDHIEEFSLQLMLANKTYHQHLFKLLQHIDVAHHYHVLLLINRLGGKTTQKVLCDTLHIEKSNMAAIIDLFERKGYVSREVNYRDRRGRLVIATFKAQETIASLQNVLGVLGDDITKEISSSEIFTFLDVLRRINYNISLLKEKQEHLQDQE